MTRSTACSSSSSWRVSGGGGSLRRRREISAGKPERAPVGRRHHPVGDLFDLLVLQQTAHQLGAGIVPALAILAARQKHLCLEPDQPAGHLEIVRGLVEAELVHHREELIGDPGDRNIRDVDLLFAEEMQQQIERTREGVHLR